MHGLSNILELTFLYSIYHQRAGKTTLNFRIRRYFLHLLPRHSIVIGYFKVLLTTLGGVVFGTQLCKTQILTRYLFSALKNFLLNRSGITEGPIPVFKSRPIWGQRKDR